MSAVTVSMAYWRCPEHVGRAVRSVLDQTYRDLRLVVVGDGEPVPPLPSDPRLTVLDLPVNRGPYYCDAVVLAATETPWFTIHAADDWSEPGRFERLLAAGADVDAVFGGSMQHDGERVEHRPVRFDRAGDELRHVGSIATGVYRTAALRAAGIGPHPDFPMVWDTAMVHLVLRALRWRHLPGEFGYHRVVRADSLTRSEATGFRSPVRAMYRERRDALWRTVIAHPVEEWPALLAPKPETAASVAADAARLRALLGEAVAA